MFGKPSDMERRLNSLRLVERVRDAEAPGIKIQRLTKLGWLVLLTRAEHEMRHLFSPALSDIGTASTASVFAPGTTDDAR